MTILSGIIEPALAHRFRVLHSNHQHFTANVTGSSIDLFEKTLKVSVRQSIVSEGFNAIMDVVSSNIAPRIEVLTRFDDVAYSLIFHGTKLISHKHELSYENNAVALHDIVWSFQCVYAVPPQSEIEAETE